MEQTQKLIDLYAKQSKHSNYQILPAKLQTILNQTNLHTNSRYETERLKYLLGKLEIKGKTVLDIGANTGYFSFELLDAGASAVHYYEGNKEHAEFVTLAANVLSFENKLKITNEYFNFDGTYTDRQDITLLFNVLHHVGDDYGDASSNVGEAKKVIINQLNDVARFSDVVVFQLGFNWHGDTNRPLFDAGTKQELISFIERGIMNDFEILHIGIAEGKKSDITYRDLNNQNLLRNDALGEFLNRPIFILESKQV